MKINKKYIKGIITGIFGLLVFILLFSIYMEPKTSSQIIPNEMNEIIKECENLSLIESAKCVKKLTKPFFKYNESNIEKELSFNELKNQGGMCESWSDYFCSLGDEFGFYTKKVYLDTGFCKFEFEGEYRNWKMNHAICFWSNKNSYAKFDGLNLDTFEFNNSMCGDKEFVRLEIELK